MTVQAIYDAESIALLVRWHDMSAENGEERAVASRAAGGGGVGARRCQADWRESFGDAEVAAATRSGPLRRGGRRASRPAIRVLRRGRPDSLAVPTAPASPTSSSATAELGGSLVLRSGPPRSFSSPAGKRDIAPNDTGSHWCRELRPGRMVGHLQAAPSRKLGRRVLARRVHADRLLGLGRVLARAWQQARSRPGILYVEPEVVPSAVGPMVRTALLILAIELIVIGWVRWRYGSRARAGSAVNRAAAATSA